MQTVSPSTGRVKKTNIIFLIPSSSLFSPHSASVLRHFGVILRVHVSAQTQRQDHGQQLQESDSEADPENDPDVCEQPALHAVSTARVIDGPVGRLSLTESAVGEVSRGQRDVLTGAGEEELRAVHDDHVPAPVHPTAPPTALHVPLDEVPRLLRGRVVPGVVIQNFRDDL